MVDNKKTADIVLQMCLKMYKVSDKFTNHITNVMEDWWLHFTAGGQILAELKIQITISRGNSLLLFVIVIISLNYIFKKWTWDYKFTK